MNELLKFALITVGCFFVGSIYGIVIAFMSISNKYCSLTIPVLVGFALITLTKRLFNGSKKP